MELILQEPSYGKNRLQNRVESTIPISRRPGGNLFNSKGCTKDYEFQERNSEKMDKQYILNQRTIASQDRAKAVLNKLGKTYELPEFIDIDDDTVVNPKLSMNPITYVERLNIEELNHAAKESLPHLKLDKGKMAACKSGSKPISWQTNCSKSLSIDSSRQTSHHSHSQSLTCGQSSTAHFSPSHSKERSLKQRNVKSLSHNKTPEQSQSRSCNLSPSDQQLHSRSRFSTHSPSAQQMRSISRERPLQNIQRSVFEQITPRQSRSQSRCSRPSPSDQQIRSISRERSLQRDNSRSPSSRVSPSVRKSGSNSGQKLLQFNSRSSPQRTITERSQSRSQTDLLQIYADQNAYNEVQNEAQNETQNEAQNETQNEAQNEVQNEAHNEAQNNTGKKRITLKMSQFVLNCIKYYEASNGTGFEERRKRYALTQDNKIYLGENISIFALKWEIIKTYKPTLFLTELALIIWDGNDLCNRALDLSRGIQNIPSRSPVKLIEKNLLRLLISLYSDFLSEYGCSNHERVKMLLKATYVLRHKIRDLRAEKRKAMGENPLQNPRRKLRYNYID